MNYSVWVQDCLTLPKPQVEGARLLYLDPPYGPQGEDTYFGVGKDADAYLAYVVDRVQVLSSYMVDYNVVVHVDPKYSHYLKVALDGVLGRENFKNEIVWCYSGPSVAKTHMPRKHDVLLWYGMGSYVYNPIYVPYVAGLRVGGGSAWSKEAKDEAAYIARGKHLEDWWSDIPALVRNEKEKRGYPTQKPQKLLDRTVTAFSNEGDLVVDPMMGSGTTLMSCMAHRRKFVGCDLNPEAVQMAEMWAEENLGLMTQF